MTIIRNDLMMARHRVKAAQKSADHPASRGPAAGSPPCGRGPAATRKVAVCG
jgi:hypothetical protein